MRPAWVIVLSLALAASAHAQNQPRFLGVGDLAGGATDSVAAAVSADGRVVVGASVSANGDEAFRWTETGGIQGLGDLPGGEFLSFASAVSADGGVVAGTGVDSADESTAFRWTSSGGLSPLGAFFCSLCPPHAFGMGLSADGQVVVGEGFRKPLLGSLRVEAARWAGGGSSIDGLGHLSGPGQASVANGVSGDGAVIAGDSDTSAGVEAFVWTASAGMQPLAVVPGALPGSSATAVASGGGAIAGFVTTSATDASSREAARWTGAGFGTLELLGTLPGGGASRANAISGDGAVVVGTARTASGDDAAFLWDATHGMRELGQVLADDYGLDVVAAGWTLTSARGVSDRDVQAGGELVVVGEGTNPAGDPEGWVAVLSPTACNDGVDNDGDGLTDAGQDPECTARYDRSETPDCSDGLDQDGDGLADHPADPECTGPDDWTETPDCSDGLDRDGDGLVDFPADPGCRDADGLVEDPACNDGVDNDGNGESDFPADAGCVAADDASEGADCSDGLDNDGDGLLDLLDPDCQDASDPAEDPECSDRVDNDGGGGVDYPDAYPACSSAQDPIEQAACRDGLDNDGDGDVDHPADTGCFAPGAPSEAPVALAIGDLLVTSRNGRRLFRHDPGSGAQTEISVGAGWTAPQAVAVRPQGQVLVADPAGVFEVIPAGGQQRRLSEPFPPGESLALADGDAGRTLLLHRDGIVEIPWTTWTIAEETPVLTLPLPGNALALFHPDSLARESDGRLLVTGLGVGGDGIHRYDPSTGSLETLSPGFSGDLFTDLALEADGTILAVGVSLTLGPGVFRVTPSGAGMGSVAALSTGSEWTDPSAVAVGLGGEIYVADAGDCSSGPCTGAALVEVDPATGVRTNVWSGGFADGPMDLAVVSALPQCANGLDDDGDGKVDLLDPQCTTPWGTLERKRGCGLGAEAAVVVAALLLVRRRRACGQVGT